MRHRDEQRLFTGEHLLSFMRLKRKLPWHFEPGRDRSADGTNPHGIDLHIMIVTVNRNAHRVDRYEPRYLTQTVTMLIRQLDDEFALHPKQYSRVNLTVCNVEARPESYTEAHRMAFYLDVISKYDSNWTAEDKGPKTASEQTVEGFVFCVAKSVQSYRNRLLLVLHDDMVPSESFFTTLRSLLTSTLPSELGEFYHQNMGFIKLHQPATQIGFFRLPFSELLLLCVALCTASVLIALLYFRVVLGVALRDLRDSRVQHLPFASPAKAKASPNAYRRFLLCCGVLLVYTLLVCASLGASTVLRLRKLYAPFGNDYVLVDDTFACCHRALLFGDLSAREFVQFASRTLHLSHLMNEQSEAVQVAKVAETASEIYTIDSLLNAFVSGSSFQSFTLLPNAMQHIGLYPAHSDRLRSTDELDW